MIGLSSSSIKFSTPFLSWTVIVPIMRSSIPHILSHLFCIHLSLIYMCSIWTGHIMEMQSREYKHQWRGAHMATLTGHVITVISLSIITSILSLSRVTIDDCIYVFFSSIYSDRISFVSFPTHHSHKSTIKINSLILMWWLIRIRERVNNFRFIEEYVIKRIHPSALSWSDN